MPKITKEESDARRAEIIDACEALYRSESYHDITMTQIAAKVSFGRANVYNYFQNKDEILLALLQREHELWADDLASLRESGMALEDESLADGIAASLEKRTQMLKLLAMNLYDIEQNSRPESLVAFKHAYKRVVDELERLLRTSKPHWNEARASRFVFGLVPYTHGVYPFVFHSDKQLAAMSAANVTHPELSIRTLVRDLALSLLRDET